MTKTKRYYGREGILLYRENKNAVCGHCRGKISSIKHLLSCEKVGVRYYLLLKLNRVRDKFYRLKSMVRYFYIKLKFKLNQIYIRLSKRENRRVFCLLEFDSFFHYLTDADRYEYRRIKKTKITRKKLRRFCNLLNRRRAEYIQALRQPKNQKNFSEVA